jgi:hypothetical protein
MTVLNLFGKHQAHLSGHRTLPSWRSVVRGYPQADDFSRHSGAILTAWWVAAMCCRRRPISFRPGAGLACARERVGAGAVGSWRLLVSRRHHGVGSAPWLRDRIGVRRGVGFTIVHWPILEKSTYPYVVGFQSLPKVALAPLMVVWFGFGSGRQGVHHCGHHFFSRAGEHDGGYQSVEPERIELAYSCNASQWHLITKIIIPSCLPFLFAGLSVASVLAILGAVVGELVGAALRARDAVDAVQPVHGNRAGVRRDPAARSDRLLMNARSSWRTRVLLLGPSATRIMVP